jgi:hypothetical protein
MTDAAFALPTLVDCIWLRAAAIPALALDATSGDALEVAPSSGSEA